MAEVASTRYFFGRFCNTTAATFIPTRQSKFARFAWAWHGDGPLRQVLSSRRQMAAG